MLPIASEIAGVNRRDTVPLHPAFGNPVFSAGIPGDSQGKVFVTRNKLLYYGITFGQT